MKNSIDGLCSLQEYNQLRNRIYDAVDEWKRYFESDPTFGILINSRTYEVSVESYENIANSYEWFSCETLLEDGNVDASAVLDLTDRFCFVKY